MTYLNCIGTSFYNMFSGIYNFLSRFTKGGVSSEEGKKAQEKVASVARSSFTSTNSTSSVSSFVSDDVKKKSTSQIKEEISKLNKEIDSMHDSATKGLCLSDIFHRDIERGDLIDKRNALQQELDRRETNEKSNQNRVEKQVAQGRSSPSLPGQRNGRGETYVCYPSNVSSERDGLWNWFWNSSKGGIY